MNYLNSLCSLPLSRRRPWDSSCRSYSRARVVGPLSPTLLIMMLQETCHSLVLHLPELELTPFHGVYARGRRELLLQSRARHGVVMLLMVVLRGLGMRHRAPVGLPLLVLLEADPFFLGDAGGRGRGRGGEGPGERLVDVFVVVRGSEVVCQVAALHLASGLGAVVVLGLGVVGALSEDGSGE